MSFPTRLTRSEAFLGLGYFAAAALAVQLTRYDGGVAFLWAASSLLIAALIVRSRRSWGGPILACGFASILATGLLGLGWTFALPFAFINMVEAVVSAFVFRRLSSARSPLSSLRWLGHFVLAVGIIGPLASSALVAATMAIADREVLSTTLHFYVGHALGNLTFIPVMSLLVRRRAKEHPRLGRSTGRAHTAGLLLLVAATTFIVFAQSALPLLFLPMLPVILTTFRRGQSGAALGIVIIALVGGGMTLAGGGPIQLVAAELGARMQFLQFYLAATVLTVLPVAADLRQRARLHRDLRLSEERYRLLADHSTDIIMHLECDGRIRFVSPSVRQLGGYHPRDIVGRNAGCLVAPADRNHVSAQHKLVIAAAGQTLGFEYRGITRQGEERWFETHTRAVVGDDGQTDGVVSIIRDISDRKAQEQKLTAAAMTDPLTGLLNRRAFRAAASELTHGAARTICVALLDVDHFKAVNDRHGHDAGDEVLRTFGIIAAQYVRRDDVVARIGGEEFAILLPDMDEEAAFAVCNRIREEVAQSVCMTDAGPVRVTISGGVARLGTDGLDLALKRADRALYAAKEAGRDRMALAA